MYRGKNRSTRRKPSVGNPNNWQTLPHKVTNRPLHWRESNLIEMPDDSHWSKTHWSRKWSPLVLEGVYEFLVALCCSCFCFLCCVFIFVCLVLNVACAGGLSILDCPSLKKVYIDRVLSTTLHKFVFLCLKRKKKVYKHNVIQLTVQMLLFGFKFLKV